MLSATQLLSSAEQEGQVAYKPEATTPAKLAETMVAFANAHGGFLVIGADPRSGEPQGLEDPDAAQDRTLKAALATDPPLIIPLPQNTEMDEKSVLVVTIPPGLPHVYSYKGKYLVRDGDRNLPLAPRHLRRLMMERGAVSFEAMVPDGARLDDIAWERVGQYLSNLDGLPATNREEALLQRGCLSRSDDLLRPTYAGLLLFGREPQRWVPTSRLLAVRYPGRTMDDSFVREEILGTLPEQIRRAEAFVVGNMRRGVRLRALERAEETEYPVGVVREAIVNAIAHRSYQVRGNEIRVLMFSDRIEFYSPGRLPGHVTVENLVDERFSRNECIVQVLSDMGFIERLGYGIDRMIHHMAEAKLPPPRFKETAAGFQVSLLGPGTALVTQDVSAHLWRHLGLNQRQEIAMAHLIEKERITHREYHDLCSDVSAETIRRDLVDLVHKNLLLKISDKRETYYILK
jgi:ATP-dependent DNA helicase RecG